MRAAAVEELSDPKLRQPCRKVLESLQEHWTGLMRFVDDPRIPIDNNASERAGRGPAVARKNFYGSGSLWSGRLAATMFSLFATLAPLENQSATVAGVVSLKVVQPLAESRPKTSNRSCLGIFPASVGWPRCPPPRIPRLTTHLKAVRHPWGFAADPGLLPPCPPHRSGFTPGESLRRRVGRSFTNRRFVAQRC